MDNKSKVIKEGELCWGTKAMTVGLLVAMGCIAPTNFLIWLVVGGVSVKVILDKGKSKKQESVISINKRDT